MSWDIFVQDLPRDAKTLSDIPPDFKPTPLGKRDDITAKIKGVVPSADFSNPAWGVVEGDGWSIELNMGDEEICTSFAFHVRGGETAIGVVSAILEHLKLRALDSGTGDFFVAGPQATESFRRWLTYRDHAVGDSR